MACETIKDLFVTNLLPDRKLKCVRIVAIDLLCMTLLMPIVVFAGTSRISLWTTRQSPSTTLCTGTSNTNSNSSTPSTCKSWRYVSPKRFKSQVHARFCCVHGQMTWWFSLFPILMQVNSKDTVASQRQQMIKHIYDLLNAKPEQERTLLSLIINKFVRSLASQVLVCLCNEVDSPHPRASGPCLQGDLEKKISSSVVYQLTNLLQKHPGMKMAVVKEVQPLLYRANVSLRAQCVSLLCLPLSLFSPRV